MITFMGLLASVLAERVHVGLAVWSLGPLLACGVGSVVQWHFSEQAGQGDMRFYLVMQFYSIAVLIALLLLFPPRYTRTGDLVAALAAYAVAKALEALDGQIYTRNGFVSGHTLKHLVAGLSAYLVLHMLERRRGLRG
jgi:xanthine/uracil permease